METAQAVPVLTVSDLLSLPEEVLYRCIFPLLNFGDVLRMRRVCKHIKSIADDFIWTSLNSNVREINETNYTFQKFIDLNIPTTSLYLNNSSPSFFEDIHVNDFLQLYGNKITHVKINHFGTFISEHELHFFTNLPNLQHLDISFIDASQRNCSYDHCTVNDVLVPRERSPFSQNFKNLKTLKLNEIQGSHPRDYGYAWDFIEFCENLEYAKHPYFRECFFDKTKKLLGPFDCLVKYTRRRQQLHPDLPNLQYYDLQHYEETGYFLNEFCVVIKACHDRGVKLLNMHSDLFRMVAREFRPAPETFKLPLVSLKNVHGYMFCEELPNLEKLTIESTARSCYAFTWLGPWRFISIPVPKWPKLKSLDMTIDSVKLTKNGQFPAKNIDELYTFLFVYAPETEKRTKLRELALRFSREPEGCEIDQLPVPKVQEITKSCPFITKLTLSNWLGTNKAVTLFWEGLPFLEEVVLDKCEKLGDVAFVGKDRENPVFLQLTELKKLSLIGLEMMPKITDLVFELVFRHLKIKYFCLTSDVPVKFVTRTGIESLVTGNFNNSVDRFSFENWSLEGVSDETFEKIKMKFRAFSMV